MIPQEAKAIKGQVKQLEDKCDTLTKELKAMTANSESWECVAKLDSKLPCGHPNDCGYDIKGNGTWSHIGCYACKAKRLSSVLSDIAIVAIGARWPLYKVVRKIRRLAVDSFDSGD
tara:strand:- start:49417 stop:49764 length:348 start_codon:yes stop_codon:yes gene_type:complete